MIRYAEFHDSETAEESHTVSSQKLVILSSLDVSRVGLRILVQSLTNPISIREARCPSEIFPNEDENFDLILLDLFSDRQGMEDVAGLMEYPLLAGRTLAVLDTDYPGHQKDQLFHAGIGGMIEPHGRREEWKEAVHALLKGKTYYSRRVRAEQFSTPLVSGRPDTPHPLSSLSPREVEIFQWIGCGHSTQQMAEKLGLSTKTIETYREHIKQKLELRNASELTRSARLWVEQGVIDQKTGPEALRANGR